MARQALRGSPAETRYLKDRVTKSAAVVGQMHYAGQTSVNGHSSNLSEFLRIARNKMPFGQEKGTNKS
jgi:hypothetical protein